MQPFFFGPSNSLYGAYHPAEMNTTAPETAVVICQSIGHEYMRAYRACWQLAETAARRNAHVLRFDYAATGDSQGRQTERSWTAWVDSVGHAIDWLADHTGLVDVRLLGLRVGALMGAQAAVHSRSVNRAVLWDPVFDGAQFMHELTDMHVTYTRAMNRYRPLRHRHAEHDTDEYLGFHLPRPVTDALAEARLSRMLPRGAVDWHLACSSGLETADDDLLTHLAHRGGRCVALPEPMDWHDVDAQYRRLTLPRSTNTLLDLLLESS
ncbi:hypothetical protein [Salinisphaera sp. T31B1]|uniref:hypothetical protein n=1 Tax=Salinisphaera sp. T31B1 TaxID=727963 RepID=UPI003341086B